jgi:ABC-type sugar transport system ATPase subunit
VTVDFHEPLGSHVLVHAMLGDATVAIVEDASGVVVQAPADVRPAPGQRLTLSADAQHIYLFDAATGAALGQHEMTKVVAT